MVSALPQLQRPNEVSVIVMKSSHGAVGELKTDMAIGPLECTRGCLLD